MSDVTPLSSRSRNSMHWDVPVMLRQLASEIEDGAVEAGKAVVLTLDTTDGEYNVGFANAQMSSSEMLALLEVAKTVILNQMGYL